MRIMWIDGRCVLVLHREQVFLVTRGRQGRGWGRRGALWLGKGIREELVTWGSSVGLSLHISKMGLGWWGQTLWKV